MKTPYIETTDGKKILLTELPDKLLIKGYLSIENAEDTDLVRLLLYATNDEDKAGAILRKCLTKNKKLLAVYPGLGDKAPQNATLIGGIIDGSLYLV